MMTACSNKLIRRSSLIVIPSYIYPNCNGDGDHLVKLHGMFKTYQICFVFLAWENKFKSDMLEKLCLSCSSLMLLVPLSQLSSSHPNSRTMPLRSQDPDPSIVNSPFLECNISIKPSTSSKYQNHHILINNYQHISSTFINQQTSKAATKVDPERQLKLGPSVSERSSF